MESMYIEQKDNVHTCTLNVFKYKLLCQDFVDIYKMVCSQAPLANEIHSRVRIILTHTPLTFMHITLSVNNHNFTAYTCRLGSGSSNSWAFKD